MLDPCRERHRTRDRLLNQDFSVIPRDPEGNIAPVPYPQENYQSLVIGTIATFPVPGLEHCLYLDRETDILYYFKAAAGAIAAQVAEQLGVFIAGQDGIYTYIYIPVRALPLENLIFDGSDASAYID